jgi:hypothetical protein
MSGIGRHEYPHNHGLGREILARQGYEIVGEISAMGEPVCQNRPIRPCVWMASPIGLRQTAKERVQLEGIRGEGHMGIVLGVFSY